MAPAIAILGAGPAGLTLGRLLHLANIDFVIFEREESASKAFNRGGTLDLHNDSGQLALKEAGLYDQFKALARHNVTNRIADSQGTVYMEPSGEDEGDKPEIDRKDLRKLLLSSVPEENVRWASKIQSVQKDANGSVSIQFANGSTESGFRLVIGADGAWSKARALVVSKSPIPQNFATANKVFRLLPQHRSITA
jgi:2-polyprenyl-6-methoxyphenol hydroxylase-like FAD-dependent oxidoreductase